MTKNKFFIGLLVFAVLSLSVVSSVFAASKKYIVGYDVNNGYAKMTVEAGIYYPGISLYPQNIGISTKSNLSTTGNLTVSGNASLAGTLSVTGVSTLTGATTISGETQAQRVVQGGTVTDATSTLTGPLTLTAAQVCNNSVITVNSAATVANLTAASIDITLPATSTLFADCLDTNGDKASFLFINSSPTAATTTEIIAGTGCNAMISGDTGAADTIAGSAGALITIYRATDYLGVNGTADCFVTIEEMISH